MIGENPTSPSRPRVLLVEDDPASANAMRLLLEHYGFDVCHAQTLCQARQLLGSQPVYVFLDLMLPDGDGAALLEDVRRSGLKTCVAIITGTSDPEHLRRVKRLAPDMILHKPVDFFQLLEKIKRPA
jgi:DNA-binding response OmpR family regulator